MSKLNAKKRNKLPARDFALPKKREYPIEDKGHARDALSRVSGNGSSSEKKEVKTAVHRKFPSIKQKSDDHKVDGHSAIGHHDGARGTERKHPHKFWGKAKR